MHNLISKITSVNGCSVFTALLISAASFSSQAVVIVNTGTPVGTSEISIGNNFGQSQSLGGQFTVGANQNITQIEAWMRTTLAGNMTVSLWFSVPDRFSAPVYSFTSSFAVAVEGWQVFNGFSWPVVPAIYAVTFSPAVGYAGNMRTGAPAPLSQYFYLNSGTPNWFSDSTLGLGVRITAVPEPQSSLLMFAGIGVVGWAARTRRPKVL